MQRGFFQTQSNQQWLKRGVFMLLIMLTACSSARVLNSSGDLFGYNESQQPLLNNTGGVLQQWRDVLNRQRSDELNEERCLLKADQTSRDCQLIEWKEFLFTLKGKTALEQIKAVNLYANQKAYKLDRGNYGANDYWATPREFLNKGGDCEDYAITKLLSLRQLGFSVDSMRMVVLIDTNLRIPHAVLAVYTGNDIMVLDNQVQEVVSHQKLSNYVPIYSINEKGWWIHTSPTENLGSSSNPVMAGIAFERFFADSP